MTEDRRDRVSAARAATEGLLVVAGGIDSPVAAWLLMRRGTRPTFVHFFSGRSVEEADADKIIELARILATWSPEFAYGFTAVNRQLYLHAFGAGQEVGR